MDSERFGRKSPRLKGYDYTEAGAYFVTICTLNRVRLFGDVVDDAMRLNTLGEVVFSCWDDLPRHYSHVELDAFVVMPNHVHGIIVLIDENGEGLRPSPTTPKRHALTEVVRAFKSFSTRRINEQRDILGVSVWQRSFHDHIIRNEKELNILREYILYNPAKWSADRYYEGGS